MAVQPFDIEGQLPVEINFQTQVTIENFSLDIPKPLSHRGSAKGITGISEGLEQPTFTFRMPILATPALTELNVSKFKTATGKSKKFTLAMRNSVGARITLIGCKLGRRAYSNTPLSGDAGAEFSGSAEEALDT